MPNNSHDIGPGLRYANKRKRRNRRKKSQSEDLRAQQLGRIPESCPEGLESRYTVQPGDTMFIIAQMFGVSLEQLVAANPHIPDPTQIFPGDVLCVPTAPPATLPCCVLLEPAENLPPGALGSALFRPIDPNLVSITVTASRVPPPSFFGDFDGYEALVIFPPPVAGGPGIRLFPVPEEPPTWAGSDEGPLAPGFTTLPSNTRVIVRPVNTETEAKGETLLEGTLAGCVEKG